MRILIAEDNAEIAALIRLFLEKEGYEVIWKEDGQAALDFLLEQEVHLCIFDIMMPRLDGFSLIQKVNGIKLSPIPCRKGADTRCLSLNGGELFVWID